MKLKQSFKKISTNCYATIFIIFLILSIVLIAKIQIFYNTTNSLPQKFFLVQKEKIPQKNEYALFYKENQWYQIPFTKKVIGVQGDKINEINNSFWISSNSRPFLTPAGVAKEYSISGDKLTKTKEKTIPKDYFYFYASHENSLDSRYEEIGLIHKSDIIGKAIPLHYKHLMVFIFFVGISFFTVKTVLKVWKKTILSAILAFTIINLPTDSFAKDLGVHGQIYEIKETNLLSDIKNKLSNLESSGELAKLQKEWQQKTIKRAERPKPVSGLLNATKTKDFDYDPSIIADKNIYDHQGNIIVKKGTKVNPLNYKNLTENLLFIDGDNQDQVNWALKQSKQHPSLIILTNGSVMQLMRNNKVRFYFDQNGYLIKTFGIKFLPAKVYQNKDLLKIKEVAL